MFEEIEDTRKALCERCKKFVPVSDIKFLPKGDNARISLCTRCLKAFKSEDEKKKKVVAKSASFSSGKSYFCGRCRYKFKLNLAGDATIRCPYCGKSDKMLEDKAIDADSLLRQADD